MGSLFKLRDYWSNRYNGEEFSHNYALSVGNVDNDPSGDSKIIIGSFSGMLRIIRPLKKGSMQPEDTLLEKDFGEPILQVACRPLEPINGGAAQNLLAILFPKRIVLARVMREGVSAGKEDALNILYNLIVYFEASLEHTSYNFACGTFGHASHEMVCVQSMNGHLTIVDHNKVLLQCVLPHEQFLIPGCLVYCAARDCFLTISSAMCLMCYSFASLSTVRAAPADVFDIESGERGRSSTAPRGSIAPTWAFALGEDAVAVEICRLTRGLAEEDADIIVLCPATLFVLQLNGELRFARRLDMEAVCAVAYPVPSAGACNLLIGTMCGSVHVFSDTSLEWSAKMTSGAPLCLAVADDMCKTKGLIVSLSTEGVVALNYLGTDPADEPIQPLESKEFDFVAMDHELRKLQHAIRLASGDPSAVTPAPSHIPNADEAAKIRRADMPATADGPRLRVALVPPTVIGDAVAVSLWHDGPGDVQHVAIAADVVAPLRVETPVCTIARVAACGAVHVPLHVFVQADRDAIVPSSLEMRVVVTYGGTPDSGALRVVTATARMPFALVARPTPPVRCQDFVFQLNTDREDPPSLRDIFPDMASGSEHVSAHVMSVQYVNGADATILVSKSACRFRLQSSAMDALWLLADELRCRLRALYGAELRFEVPGELPLDYFFIVIDTHMAMRRELADAQEALARAAQAFRVVQKRLLVSFRERNPAPLDVMGGLLDECYGKLQSSADNVSAAALRQRQAVAMLCCCSRLVVMQLLIKCQDTLQEAEDAQLLESIFTCAITHDDGVAGWEEATMATLENLCRSDKRMVNKTNGSSCDVEQLKQSIRELFDQLIRGSLKTLTRRV